MGSHGAETMGLGFPLTVLFYYFLNMELMQRLVFALYRSHHALGPRSGTEDGLSGTLAVALKAGPHP